ncbi:MAG: tRNA lysidine(34) synthetase TilS [Planctomycetota bacterium]
MRPASAVIRARKRDPVVHRVLSAWRRLTDGKLRRDADRPTIVACSGGADSSALAIALAASSAEVVLLHAVHDLRPASEAFADADAVRELAERTGCAFALAECSVAGLGGNLERAASRARKRALLAAAESRGIPFIATGHTADDQLETLLMRVVRGSGPRGMRGILPVRSLRVDGGTASIVRPMLGVNREDAAELCRRVGWAWREDRTNLDAERVRSAIRARVIPELKAIVPSAANGAALTAATMARHEEALETRARSFLRRHLGRDGRLVVSRRTLIHCHSAELGAALRLLVRQAGGRSLDRLAGTDIERLMEWAEAAPRESVEVRFGPLSIRRVGDEILIGIGSGLGSGGAPRDRSIGPGNVDDSLRFERQ